MPTSSELARRLLDEGGPVYGFYPHLNPRVPNKPDTLNTPEHRSALAEGLLSVAPGSGEAMSARDAWNASGRGAQALGEGRWGDAASAYGDMALGTLGAIPGAGYIARGTKKGAAWMDRNIPAWVNRLLDAAAPKGAQDTLYAIPAWHGSPHDFDKFDMSKIGTGEGAQSYGHGLYFAESPDVAKSYREALSPMLVNGEPVDGVMLGTYARMKHEGNLERLAETEAQNRQMRAELVEQLQNAPEQTRGQIEARLADIDEQLANIERVRGADVRKSGALYNVELDVEPEDLLDWDKPLSQQSEKVSEALKKFAFDSAPPAKEDQILSWIDPDGLYMPGGGFYEELSGSFSPSELSQKLNEAGIPGISFLDQFSRGAGAGTSNYVIFDDGRVKVLGKE